MYILLHILLGRGGFPNQPKYIWLLYLGTMCIICNSDSQNVILRTVAVTAFSITWSLLKIQILGPYQRRIESKTLGLRPNSLFFNQPSKRPKVSKYIKTISLRFWFSTHLNIRITWAASKTKFWAPDIQFPWYLLGVLY